MSTQECPRCGAGLTLETKGELLDKILLCGHCGFERDVLDEVTIEQEEAGKRVTIHRKDLGGQDVSSDILGDSDIQARVQEMTGMDMADLLSNARSIRGSGKRISRTTTTTQSFTGAEAEQKMAELGIDLGQRVRDAQARSGTLTSQSSGKKSMSVAVGVMLLLTGIGALVWSLSQ